MQPLGNGNRESGMGGRKLGALIGAGVGGWGEEAFCAREQNEEELGEAHMFR